MNRRFFLACVISVGFLCSSGPYLAGDVLVTEVEKNQVKPSMTSAPNGDLYVAVEDLSAGGIRMYRSTNGGQTWEWFSAIGAGSTNIYRNPSIAYGEHSSGEKWIYLAFEYTWTINDTREVSVLRFDLLGRGFTDWIVVDGPLNMNGSDDHVHPQVITDYVDWGDSYYVYLTYAKYGFDYYPVFFSRSTDRGLNWSAPSEVTGASENSGWPTRPEIAFGKAAGLFVTFVKPGSNGSTNSNQIWVTNSTDFGANFLAPVQVTSDSNNVFHPAIAVAKNIDTVAVAYTINWGTDMDVRVHVSTDGGAGWNLGLIPWTLDHESSVDLAVSESDGNFHAAYVQEPIGGGSGFVRYSQATTAAPNVWSPTAQINQGDRASTFSFYPRPTIAVMPNLPSSGEAAIAWTDWRGSFNNIYFGTVAIFTDGFESGDTSVWSSSVP